MEPYDMAMLAVLGGATIMGVWKGMAWQLASLASLGVSYFSALRFSPLVASYFGRPPLNRFIAMGVVYLAERAEAPFQQLVALKVLRAGLVGDEARARFARERRILARLTHPAVVPLVDGGVAADGRPYLVMQYVDGAPITDDADAKRLGFRRGCGSSWWCAGRCSTRTASWWCIAT